MKGFPFVFALLIAPLPVFSQTYPAEKLARGQYIFSVEGGCECHNPQGQPANAGGNKRENPYVLVFSEFSAHFSVLAGS
jgi:hypothetical protein